MASSYTHPSTSFDVNMQDAGMLNAKSLKPLDEVLRCRICDDYFSNCMMTKCNHNYCSVCIRRYMNYKSQCPTCFQVATEPELINNRLIDEIIRTYKKIRENLQIPCDSTDKSSEQASSSKPIVIKKIEKSIEAETSVNTASNQKITESRTSDEVSCPVCYTTVSNSRINVHLDTCLKQSADKSERKFLPKLVYHLLSDKEIRKKLKEHGLSTSGNRQALIRRHKNFIILYNANCDSLNPKPVSDLILEIERQELEERISASERSNVQVNKKSDPSLIEKEHESYVQEHKSQFNALIQDVQLRALGNLTVKKETDVTEETSNITDESGNVIGKSIFKVATEGEDPVIVKEEFSESLLEDAYHDYNVENVSSGDRALVEKDPGMDFMDSDIHTSLLTFRIKKESPFVKIKDGSKSLLDDTKNQGSEKDSLDDFESNKTPINKFPKKKYARRLSTEEKNTQRKK